MFFRLIQRQILWELLLTTFFALVGISALLTIVGVLVEASRHGLDPIGILLVIPYLIAPTLPYTLPTCLLFACTITYGAMSGANEITALKASGVHAMRVLWPAVILSVLVSALGVFLVDRVIPLCNRQLTEIIMSDVERAIYAYLHEKGGIAEPNFPYELYVQSIQDGRLIKPIIKHQRPTGGYDMVASAAEATLEVVDGEADEEKALVVLRMIDGIASTDTDNAVHFHDRRQEMPIPNMFHQSEEKMQALSFDGLYQRSNKRKKRIGELDHQISIAAATAVFNGDMKGFTQQWSKNRISAHRLQRKMRESFAEIQLRLAQSMAAIPFVLLGCPISVIFQRREFLRTFFMCFMPIVVLYYPAMLLSFNMYKEGAFELPLVMWGPSLIMGLLSVSFLKRMVRF